MGASVVFFETTASALFLSSFDATALPYVYLAAAVIVPLAGVAFSRLERRVSYRALFIATVGFLLAGMVGFRVVLALSSSKWPALALLIGVEVLAVLSTLQFWGLAGRLFDIRQGKRLFGLVGSGEVAAGVIGGFSVPALVRLLGTPNLLVLAAAAMAANLVVLIAITSKFSQRLNAEDGGDDEDGERLSVSTVFKSRYLTLMLVVSLLAVLGYFLVDYVFYDRVEARYQDEDSLAGFFGLFSALVGIVNLISRSFVSGRVINRFGLAVALLILPGTLLVTGGTLATVGTSLGLIAAIFWIAVFAKALDVVLRESIDTPSFLILYQPLPAGARLPTQTFMQSIIEPLAGGIAGAGLLIGTQLLALNAVHVAWALVAVVASWLLASVFLRRQYTVALLGALADRTLGRGGKLTAVDASAVAILERRLGSAHPGEVIYALEMLEQVEHPSLPTYLVGLLAHSSAAVREDVLDRLERVHELASFDAVQARLQKETSPRVLGAVLRTLASIGESDALEKVEPYLDNPSPAVRKGALVGMLRGGGIEGVLLAGERVTTLVGSSNPDERKFVAELLGDVGISSFHRPIAILLRDEYDTVRRAAVTAAGKLLNPRLWPLVIENLSLPLVRQAAVAALVAGGEATVDALEEAFDKEGQTRQVRLLIVKVCGRIGGPRAASFLRSRMDFADEDVRHRVLLGLRACGYTSTPEDATVIAAMIREESNDAAWNLAGLRDIGTHEEFALLSNALAGELRRDRERIMTLLSFICPREAIVRATACLEDPSGQQRAYAVEVLDNVVAPELKPLLFPILEDIPDAQKLERLEELSPQQRLSPTGRLQEILSRAPGWISPWSQACALHAIGRMRIVELDARVVSVLDADSPLLRETAVWSLGQLAPEDLADRLRAVSVDRNPTVAGMARFVLRAAGAGPEPPNAAEEDAADIEATATLLLDPRVARSRRIRAAARLASSRMPAAKAALLNGITLDDEVIRSAALRALKRGRFPLGDGQRQYLMDHLRDEVIDAEKTLAAARPFIVCGGFDAVVEALKRELDHNRERILLMAALITGRGPVEAAFYRFADDRRAPVQVEKYLEELLETLPDDATRERVSFLIQCRDLHRLLRVWSRPGAGAGGVAGALAEIAFGSPGWVRPWTRVCAMRAIVRLRLNEHAPRIVETLDDVDAMVRETAVWALSQLAPALLRTDGRNLSNDPSPLVSTTARRVTGK